MGLLASGCPDRRGVRKSAPIAVSHAVSSTLNIASIEKRGRGQQMPTGPRRKRHRGEAAESEGGVTLDLLLKHPNATLAIYI